jgi:peptide/nickel transport system permease protein
MAIPASSTPDAPALPPGPATGESRRLGGAGNALRLLASSKSGTVGAIILLLFILLAIFGSFLAPQDPNASSSFSTDILGPPTSHHLLGTDDQGRDVLSELMVGAQVSMVVGFVAGIMSAIIGTLIGVSAAYFGGWVDRILTAFDDWFLVLPFLPLAIVAATVIGTRATNWPYGRVSVEILVIGLTSWAGTSRVIRSQVLSLKERMFVERAKALGARHPHIIRKHILPNVLPLAFANTILIIAIAILSESVLSFLNLGDPLRASWGTMLDAANTSGAVAQGDWWFFLPPGICIVLVVLSFTMVGYAVEEIINPRLRARS